MHSEWLVFFAIVLGSALLNAGVMHLALGRWRKSVGQHWTVRARLLYSARRAMIGGVFSGLILAWNAWHSVHGNNTDPRWVLGVILGLTLGSYPSTREIEPRYTLRTWSWQTLWTLTHQFGLLLIFLWLVQSMPDEMNPAAWLRAALGIAVVLLIVSSAWLPVIMRIWPKKQDSPVLQRLKRVTAEATALTGVKPRYVWVVDTPLPNAFALVYIQAIAVTSRTMEIMDDDELRAVILHEMAHLRENVGMKILRLAGSITWMSLIFVKPVVHHGGTYGLVYLLWGTIFARMLIRKLMRRMESQADQAAVVGSENPLKYASALEKLYQAGQIPVCIKRNTSHPDLYDRLLQAGLTPDYPRLKPPGPMAWPGWAAFALALVVAFCVNGSFLTDLFKWMDTL